MMTKTLLVAGALALGNGPLAYAQIVNVHETRSGPTTASVYAQQSIDLTGNFEATTSGFEAKIKLPEADGGRWSAPLLWTTYQRYLDPMITPPPNTPRNTVTGMIGIHTHVLPNGKVLSWEGHNDDEHKQPSTGAVLSHAYDWNPNPNSRNGSQFYPNVYNDFDNSSSNVFCSGHAFLADGRLLVAGGHYSGGAVDRTVAAVNNSGPDYIPPGFGDVNGYIGIRNANTFDYRGTTTLGSTYAWQVQNPMAYRRWYPTVTTLANGDALAISGQRYGGPIGTTSV